MTSSCAKLMSLTCCWLSGSPSRKAKRLTAPNGPLSRWSAAVIIRHRYQPETLSGARAQHGAASALHADAPRWRSDGRTCSQNIHVVLLHRHTRPQTGRRAARGHKPQGQRGPHTCCAPALGPWSRCGAEHAMGRVARCRFLKRRGNTSRNRGTLPRLETNEVRSSQFGATLRADSATPPPFSRPLTGWLTAPISQGHGKCRQARAGADGVYAAERAVRRE